jgi:hypothetical protein
MKKNKMNITRGTRKRKIMFYKGRKIVKAEGKLSEHLL